MKKILCLTLMLLMLFVYASCSGNAAPDPELTPSTLQNEDSPVEELKIQYKDSAAEDLIIQIDVATEGLLSTFSTIHYADIRTPGDGEGLNLVIWANQTLFDFSVVALASDWLEDKNEFGFMPTFGFGSVSVLLPGEAFVIENYMGAGTLPHRGISFTDVAGASTRVLFFGENHAYPEHGGRWIIQEIEADRLIWGFSYEVDLPNEVVINRALGYDVYFEGSRVHIGGQLNVDMIAAK